MVDVVSVGETMASVNLNDSFLSDKGGMSKVGFGGSESNVSIGLQRLGHSSRWISALGDDEFGELISTVISDEGVEVVLRNNNGRQTGLMVKTISTGRGRRIRYYRNQSAASALGPEDIEESLLIDSRIVHTTGILPALSANSMLLSYELSRNAYEMKKYLSLDLNYRSSLWLPHSATPVLRDLTKLSSVVFGDRVELELVTGESHYTDEELLRQVSKLGPSEVILKLAEDGAVCLRDDQIYRQPSLKVDVVDTVGAGDAFVAGYLSGCLDGIDVEERLLRASFCGAMVCTNTGDWEGLPRKNHFQKWLDQKS